MSPYEHRQRRAHLKGTVASHREAVTLASCPGEVAIVKRGILRSVVMRCPDGCGDAITLNLDRRTDKAWRLYQSSRGLTLFPSVWRDSGCQSHFILWDDMIYWMDVFDVDEDEGPIEKDLEERVWSILRPDSLIEFVEVADALEAIPWAVLEACRRLVKAKRAAPGAGSSKTSFRRL